MLFEIENCSASVEDKKSLSLILKSGDTEFINQYLKEIEMIRVNPTASKNLPTREICRLFEEGTSIRKLSIDYNCTETSIRSHLGKGGWLYDHEKKTWHKDHKIEKNYANKKKNRQRDVINWLMEMSAGSIVTIEMVCKRFDCSSGSASGYLSEISKKGFLDHSGRGVYKMNSSIVKNTANTRSVAKNDASSSASHSIPSVNDYINEIIGCSRKVGGLEKLISMASSLVKG